MKYNTARINTKDVRAITKLLNANGHRGLKKHVAFRFDVDTGFQSFNAYLTGRGGNDDLINSCDTVQELAGAEIFYDPRDSLIKFDIWLYDRWDRLEGHADVWGICVLGKVVEWTTTKPQPGDVLRGAVKQVTA